MYPSACRLRKDVILGVGQYARLHFLCCGVIVETSVVESLCLTKIFFNVKTTFYTSVLILALCCGSGAVAQNQACKTSSQTKPCPDSVLLSKRIDGNYEVRQYLVRDKTTMDTDYTVRFPINSSQMSQTFSDNASEIRSLKNFVAKFRDDTLMHVKAVKIKGWASPDGVEASNRKLAKARAAAFATYLRSQCPEMKNFAVETSFAVATWSDCLPMLERSSVANRTAAADIINGKHTMATKEAHLSKMPAVWDYLKSSVLPEFRCAEIEIVYTHSAIVEQRVLIRKPTPTPAPAPVQQPPQQQQQSAQNRPVVVEKQIEYIIIEDKRNGVIVEMDEVDVDWD